MSARKNNRQARRKLLPCGFSGFQACAAHLIHNPFTFLGWNQAPDLSEIFERNQTLNLSERFDAATTCKIGYRAPAQGTSGVAYLDSSSYLLKQSANQAPPKAVAPLVGRNGQVAHVLRRERDVGQGPQAHTILARRPVLLAVLCTEQGLL